MNFVDIHPHAMLRLLSEKSFRDMSQAMREDPFSLRYILSDGTIVNVEISAKRFMEGLLRLTIDNQIVFWTSICTVLPENGMIGKLVDDQRYAATFVRLKTDDGSVGFRVSP